MSFRYHQLLFPLGIWLIIAPFVGLPRVWEILLLVIPGALIFIISIILAQDHAVRYDTATDYAHKDSIDENHDKEIHVEDDTRTNVEPETFTQHNNEQL